MTENDDRYGKNRNVWRKVYGYNRRKPKTVTFVDSGSQGRLTFDLNTTYKHRDFFKVERKDLQPLPFPVQYDEGLVTFTGETQQTANYNFNFNRKPLVVYTVESASLTGSENINVFGLSLPDFGNFTVGASAPFSGTVRYRAVSAPEYPVFISASTFSPTASFWIFADEIDAVQATAYTASFTIPTGTLEYRASVHDVAGNGSADVDLENVTLGVSQSTNTISAQLSNKIHFHVTKP